jgi:hypothetical protein
MVDDLKNIKNTIKNTIFSSIHLSEDEIGEKLAGPFAKSLINQMIQKAGKGKDDIVQILGREIGFAVAAVLKDPLSQLVEGKKIQISLELVNKDAKTSSSKNSNQVVKKKSTKKKAKKATAKKKT